MSDPTRTALITGAAGGIGRAVVEALQGAGHSVAALDIDGAALATLPRGTVALPVDPTDARATERAVDEAVRRLGGLDLVVNNAGLVDRIAPLHRTDDALWRRVFAVNLEAPMVIGRRVVPHLIERGGGTIVTIASVAGLRGGAAGAAYTASKHAVIGLVKHIAWHYADRDVYSVAIAPGPVAPTGMSMVGADDEGVAATEPVLATARRTATPQEIARLVLRLADPDLARLVNGAVLPADSGWSAG
jgi:NAD(P)-dependent dehydrogenase (short-subunit alcohol dehydrogenase family)